MSFEGDIMVGGIFVRERGLLEEMGISPGFRTNSERKKGALQQMTEKAMDTGREQNTRGRKQTTCVLDKACGCIFFAFPLF